MKKIIIILVLLLIGATVCVSADTTFTVTYQENRAIMTPATTNNCTQHKWNISFNDGIENGSTGWIVSNVTTYIHWFSEPDSVTVTLYVKNDTTRDSYTTIIESFYEPPYSTEVFDIRETVPKNQGVGPDLQKNPWNPWYSISEGDASNFPLLTVMIMVIITVIMIISVTNRKTIEKFKIGNYIIEYVRKR